MFKDQARYVVRRQDQHLWQDVLRNKHRQELLDEVYYHSDGVYFAAMF